MKRVFCLFAASLGALLIVGCQSTGTNLSLVYAGGTGAFGEDPAQPGEHSGQRFRQAIAEDAEPASTAVQAGPTTRPQ
jgi:hypothetical protein